MEERKVQKTGDMHYVYLPTNWCKKHKITSDSKLSIEENSTGALVLYPRHTKKEEKTLELSIDEEDQDIINKLIMACYINPLSSFKIRLSKDMDVSKLLIQKNIMSIESVEIDKKVISSDSSISLSDPDLLLKTLVKKVKNLVVMMNSNYNEELMKRYEEEVDRSKILIEKSIISYMTYSSPPKLKMIDLFYISQITRDLERTVDHLINLKKQDANFIKQIEVIIQNLKDNIERWQPSKKSGGFEYKNSIEFLKKVKKLSYHDDKKNYDKRRIKSLLLNVSEVLLDWSITEHIDLS